MEEDGIQTTEMPVEEPMGDEGGLAPGGSEFVPAAEAEQATQPAEQGADATPEQEPATVAEPVQQEESFAHSFDPSALPDELQPAYKNMLADYTRKTRS